MVLKREKGDLLVQVGGHVLLNSCLTLKSPSEYKISLLLPRPHNSAQEHTRWA